MIKAAFVHLTAFLYRSRTTEKMGRILIYIYFLALNIIYYN